MSTLRVNIKNEEYIRVTNNKGKIGIGKPYADDSQSNDAILVDSAALRQKIEGFNKLLEDINKLDTNTFALRSSTTISNFLPSFKRSIRDILYPVNEGVPAQVAGNNVDTFFTYTYPTVQPTLPLSEQERVAIEKQNAISAARIIINDWLNLFVAILAPTTGLSSILTAPTAPPPPPSGGVDADGDEYENLTWQASSVTDTYGSIEIALTKPIVKVSDALYSASAALLDLKLIQFFDKQREYKTVLNLGNDTQYLIQAWRPVQSDTSSIQLKLFEPVNKNIARKFSFAYIGRELANSVVDVINIEYPPVEEVVLSLRPKNTNIQKYNINKATLQNATLDSLGMITGSSGSITDGVISYNDRIFNRWYTADFNSSELNIDFSDYKNFVQFGSAAKRLEAFREKLKKIEGTVTASISSSNRTERARAEQREYIKRNFDAYEQYLFFAPQTQQYYYSASAYYTDTGTEFNPTGSWPKYGTSNELYAVSSSVAVEWYTAQHAIATRYDEYNQNYLVYQLPEHIQEDLESEEFKKFISMFGHVMDNIKSYIDQYPNIYSTSPDPLDELSLDQVYEVAQSFGLNLPNAYSLEQLQTFIADAYGTLGARELVAETWKRMIHSAMYVAKTKGSRTSYDTMLNVYGISTPMISLKETAYPTSDNYTKSDEAVYALQFSSGSANRIRLPFYSSSVSASSFYTRFIPEFKQNSSLVTGDDKWAIDLELHPSTSYADISRYVQVDQAYRVITTEKYVGYGRISILSGSNRVRIASSSYFPLFKDDFTSIILRKQSADFIAIQTDGDQILYEFSASSNIPAILWNNTRHLHIGGSGSIKLNEFDGKVDEVRVWKEELSKGNFTKLAYDPGAYYGASYTSSYNNLYVDLSFSQPYASITQSATNETVYENADIVSYLPANGFTTASYVRIIRPIRQYSPIVGASVYTNRKVIVQPPPAFGRQFITSDGAYELRRDRSIKTVAQKRYTSGQNVVAFDVSPSDFINSNILRSMGGNINTNNMIGSPAQLSGERYVELDNLFNYYLTYYNGTVNASQYISFYKNLIKAPSEFVETILPARAKLLKGVTIQSPILDRKRVIAQRAFRVDGTGTTAFNLYTSGSGSTDTNGMYSFDANYNVFLESDFSTITNPNAVTQKIGNTFVTASLFGDNSAFATLEGFAESTIEAKSTAPIENLPPSRQFTQYVGPYLVSSSLANDYSALDYLETAIGALYTSSVALSSSGYPRNPYLGIPNRIPSEENTLAPYYQINPTSDLNDIGATTYFNNSTGVYLFQSQSSTYEKARYKAALDIKGEVASPYIYYDAKILLRPELSVTDPSDRESTVIGQKTYASGSTYTGILRISNIMSLIALEGEAGLRFRLYADSTKQQIDLSRPFVSTPSASVGVLFDALLENTAQVFPYTLIQNNNDSLLYFTVDNTTSTPITSKITMYYFDYQPVDTVPRGYLPRHYKFTRTPWLSQKRRSYLGCRIISCPDGPCPEGIEEYDAEPRPIDRERVAPSAPGRSNTPPQDAPNDRGGDRDRTTDRNPPGSGGITFGGGGTLI